MTAVDPVKRSSSPSIFPAVPTSRKANRTPSYNRSSRSRSLPLPPSTASSNYRKSPISLSRAGDKRPSPKHLPIRLNYVTVHDPAHPITSPSRHPTWVPASTATSASCPIGPLHISPLKNVTSQLIDRQFEDEGIVVSAYPRGAPAPALAWDAWEETVFSLAKAQLTAHPTVSGIPSYPWFSANSCS